jgi:hypothetical protein
MPSVEENALEENEDGDDDDSELDARLSQKSVGAITKALDSTALQSRKDAVDDDIED